MVEHSGIDSQFMRTNSRQNKQKRKGVKNFFFGLILCLFMLGGMGVLYILRYYSFLHNLSHYERFTTTSYEEPIFPKLNTHQIINLGWAHSKDNHPKSSYINFSKNKEPGTIRIGIFGCSFVEGVESAYGFDFPSLLQEEFNQSGMTNVEVINFGVGGYGMHQSYLLWEYLGKDYDLDYTVFMPFLWHEQRDDTFLLHYNGFMPIHARYIIKNDTLKLLPVLGETRQEAMHIYNRLFTPWQYVRYDNKAPMFLRVLLPLKRIIKVNPFYHNLFDKHREIFDTYTMLFSTLAQQTDHLIFICNDGEIYEFKNTILSPDVYFLKGQISQYVDSGIYRAPLGHLSALGNQVRARELFSLLVGKKQAEFDIIELSLDPYNSKKNPFNTIPLYQYKNISVKIQQYPVASFVMQASNDPVNWRFSEELDFQEYQIQSLLWIEEGKELKFIPLSFLLRDKDPVFLSFRVDHETIQIPIGRIETSSPLVGKLALQRNNDSNDAYYNLIVEKPEWSVYIKENYSHISIRTKRKIQNVAIVAGNTERQIFQGVKETTSRIPERVNEYLRNIKTFSFKPIIANFAYLRGKTGQFAHVDKLKTTDGSLDLVVTNNFNQEERYTIVPYSILSVTSEGETLKYSDPILIPR